MIILSTLPYYIKTVSSLLLHTSFWDIPKLLSKKPFVYSLPLGLKFQVSNLMDIWTLQEVIIDQHYERLSKIPRRGTVLDIGGSIGDFSIFAKKIRQADKVHSYELNPERISLFKKNVLLNKATNITLHEKPATSLTEIFKECSLQTVDFMKIDCEGAEYTIFKNTPVNLLKKIKSISFEVHFFTPEMKTGYQKLKKQLLSAGFHLTKVANPVHDSIGFLYAIQPK